VPAAGGRPRTDRRPGRAAGVAHVAAALPRLDARERGASRTAARWIRGQPRDVDSQQHVLLLSGERPPRTASRVRRAHRRRHRPR
jgi:hypothetical protein